jgi:hypothetical protein
MITYIVLFPGEIATGATFTTESPSIEAAGEALAAYHGVTPSELLERYPGLVVGFDVLH